MPEIGQRTKSKSGRDIEWDGTNWIYVDAAATEQSDAGGFFDTLKDALGGSVNTAKQMGADALSGVTRGLGEMTANMAEAEPWGAYLNPATAPIALSMRALGGDMKNPSPDVQRLAASAGQAMPQMVDQFVGADPNSMTSTVAEMGTRAAPYLAASMIAPELGLAKATHTAAGAAGGPIINAAKYAAMRGLEGGIIDSGVGALIGDNPILSGATGVVGGTLGAGVGTFLGSAGSKMAQIAGNVRGAVSTAAEKIGMAGVPSNALAKEQMQVGLDALNELVKNYKDLSGVTLDAADYTGSEALKQLTNLLRQDRPGDFIAKDLKNQTAFLAGIQRFSDQFGGVAGKNIDEAIVEIIQKTKDAHLTAYDKVIDDIAVAAGVDPEQFMALPISTEGGWAFKAKVGELLKKYGDYSAYSGAKAKAVEILQKIEEGTATLGHFKYLSKNMLDNNLQAGVPVDDMTKGLRGAVNDAMAATIETHGGKELAEKWLSNRETLAKLLNANENKALQLIINRAEDLSAPTVVKLVLARPEWADAIVAYAKTAGGEEGVKNLLARGVLESAIDASRPKLGSGGPSFNGEAFVSAISKYQDAMPNVMKAEQVETLKRFAALAQSLSMETAPYATQVGKTPMSGVLRYGESAVQQGKELGLANAVQTMNPAQMAFNAANNGLTWFAKKNAIDRVMMDQEAASIILTDPRLSVMITERMAATVDDLKHGKIREVDMRLAAEIKGRIARTNPKLFRRLFGQKGMVSAAVTAPGKSGALAGAGASVLSPNGQQP